LLSNKPAVKPPRADPITILGATTLIKPQSTASFILCENVEEIELKTITPNELPKTICDRISSAKPRYENTKKKVGIMIIPPPMPKRPARTPENVPRKKYKKISKGLFYH
jgi:hypothetical protein